MFAAGKGSDPGTQTVMADCSDESLRNSTHLVELKELLLWLGSHTLLSKAVVAKGVGPLEHTAAVHHLGPGVCHKLELAGGSGGDLTQVLQLVTHNLVQSTERL